MVPWPEMITTSGRFSAASLHVGQDVETVAIRQPDIEQDHVVGRVFNEDQGLGRSGRCGHPVALFAQDLFERRTNLRFVVHHQDVIHEALP